MLTRLIPSVVIVIAMMGFCSPSCMAANLSWNGTTDTNWATAGNWSTGTVPAAIDTVSVNTLTNAPHITTAGAVSGAANIGQTATGELSIINGGTLTTNANIFIGGNTGKVGSTTVSGTGSSWTGITVATIGMLGNGTLSVLNGGLLSTATAWVGRMTGSSGSVTVDGAGSQLNASVAVVVGHQGAASLQISNGGSVSSAGIITIASAATSTANLIIGAASGSTAIAPGSLVTSTVSFGAGTGSIIFNHTATNYTFSPAITGNGSIVALSGVSTLSGNLSGFTGTTAVYNNAQLVLGSSYGGSVQFSNGISNTLTTPVSGNITVESSSNVNSTSVVTGNATVQNGGILSANGTISGTVAVNNGGTLKGSGTVGTTTVAGGGYVAPGNSIGTLNVAGNVSFGVGSFYDVEINASGASDLIDATGNATLTGGTVNLLPESGAYVPGTSYTILTAAGGVAGTFSSVAMGSSYVFLNPTLSYDANNVYATLNRNATTFVSQAVSGNERVVAAALDSMGSTNPVYNAAANAASAQQAQRTYKLLNGEVHASLKGDMVGAMETPVSILSSRMRQPKNSRSLWAETYTDFGTLGGSESSGTRSFEHKRTGVLFGTTAPYAGLDQSLVGVAFGYGRTNYDLAPGTDESASAHVDHITMSGFGARSYKDVSLRASGLYTYHAIDTNRPVSLPGYNVQNRSDYGAHTVIGNFEAGLPLSPSVATEVEPFASITYGLARISAFEETETASALRAQSDLTSSGNALLGVRSRHMLSFFGTDSSDSDACASSSWDKTALCSQMHGQIGWRRLLGGVAPSAGYNFAQSANIVTTGASLPRDALVINLGLTVPVSPNAEIDLNYAGSFASSASNNTLHAGFNWSF